MRLRGSKRIGFLDSEKLRFPLTLRTFKRGDRFIPFGMKGHKEPWGEFVDVKINAPEILRKQLLRAKRGTVWISSVCDPYQSLEGKYELTRRCLKELLEKQFPVNIQTKSKLVLRDMDLLKDFKEIEVGFTITTNDETIAGFFTPGAASVTERLKALEKLHATKIRTFAFIGPLLPGDPENLVADLAGLVDRVFVDRMNYLDQIKTFAPHRIFLAQWRDVNCYS